MPKKPVTEENSTIATADLKLFAEILCGTGEVFKVIAEWLESAEIATIRGTGMPSARRGVGHLGNFVATVLNAYHAERLGSPVPGIADKSVAKAGAIRQLAKQVAEAGKQASPLAKEAIELTRQKDRKKKEGTNQGTAENNNRRKS
jgi:hypothetical protein